MPNEPGATPAGSEGGATPPVEQPPTTTPPATGDEPLGEAGLKALAAERERADKAERELKALKAKDLTESERTAQERDELKATNARLESEIRSTRARTAAITAATKTGFWDPDLAASLIDVSQVQFDEAGQPKNVDALVAAIAKERPRLLNGGAGQPDHGGGPRGAPASGVDMNDLIRQAARG